MKTNRTLFWTVVDVLESCWGGIAADPGPIDLEIDRIAPGKTVLTTDAGDIQEARTIVCKQYLAVQFFAGSDPKRFGKLVEGTENTFTAGTDQ